MLRRSASRNSTPRTSTSACPAASPDGVTVYPEGPPTTNVSDSQWLGAASTHNVYAPPAANVSGTAHPRAHVAFKAPAGAAAAKSRPSHWPPEAAGAAEVTAASHGSHASCRSATYRAPPATASGARTTSSKGTPTAGTPDKRATLCPVGPSKGVRNVKGQASDGGSLAGLVGTGGDVGIGVCEGVAVAQSPLSILKLSPPAMGNGSLTPSAPTSESRPGGPNWYPGGRVTSVIFTL